MALALNTHYVAESVLTECGMNSGMVRVGSPKNPEPLREGKEALEVGTLNKWEDSVEHDIHPTSCEAEMTRLKRERENRFYKIACFVNIIANRSYQDIYKTRFMLL